MKTRVILMIPLILLFSGMVAPAAAQSKNLKLIIIRHAEKPEAGDNLSCAGFNRAMKLPEVLKAKFGIPDKVYIPSLHMGKTTPRGRMFQTITPYAVKYNLSINSDFEEENGKGLISSLQDKNGTVLIVWEHSQIKAFIKALGLSGKDIKWADDDYDSIWVITFKKGKPTLTLDKEGITPVATCSF